MAASRLLIFCRWDSVMWANSSCAIKVDLGIKLVSLYHYYHHAKPCSFWSQKSDGKMHWNMSGIGCLTQPAVTSLHTNQGECSINRSAGNNLNPQTDMLVPGSQASPWEKTPQQLEIMSTVVVTHPLCHTPKPKTSQSLQCF